MVTVHFPMRSRRRHPCRRASRVALIHNHHGFTHARNDCRLPYPVCSERPCRRGCGRGGWADPDGCDLRDDRALVLPLDPSPATEARQAAQALLANLKKNDRVLTSSGIFGTVTSVDPEQDRVSVRIDDDRGVKVVFTRASIVRIFDGSEEKSKDKDRISKEKASEIA